jgi:hypothetical protein
VNRLKLTLWGVVAVGAIALASPAHAIPALVQFSTTGMGLGNIDGAAGNYDLVGINEFDWQSSGDFAVPDLLPGGGSTAGGTVYNSFQAWALNAVVGDTVTFDLFAQARLFGMLDNGGNSITVPGLSTDGGGTGTFEITGALDAQETAELIATGVLQFTSITGTYEYFVDGSPDSDVDAGTGFTDGTSFLQGSLLAVDGTFSTSSGSGSILITNSVDSYLDEWIQTDPQSAQPLNDTTFDTLTSLRSSGEAAALDAGDVIGLSPFLIMGGGGFNGTNLGFGGKADANGEFSSVPEPTSLALLGLGLAGVAVFGRGRGRGRKLLQGD